MALIGQFAIFMEKNITPFLFVSVAIHHAMSRSQSHPPLRSLPKNQKAIDFCDCPCDDLVEVESPPMSVMALPYIAQAIVVTIVGLNMGFRWCVGVPYMRGEENRLL